MSDRSDKQRRLAEKLRENLRKRKKAVSKKTFPFGKKSVKGISKF